MNGDSLSKHWGPPQTDGIRWALSVLPSHQSVPSRLERLERMLRPPEPPAPPYVRIYFDENGYFDADGKPFDLNGVAAGVRLILPRKQATT